MDYRNINDAYSILPFVRRTRYYDNVPVAGHQPHPQDYLVKSRYAIDGSIHDFTHYHSATDHIACGSDMDTPHGEPCDLETGNIKSPVFCQFEEDCEAGFKCLPTAAGMPKQCLLESCQEDHESSSGICNKTDLIRGFSAPYRAEPIRCKTNNDCSSIMGNDSYCSDRGFCSKSPLHPLILHAKYRGMYGAMVSSNGYQPV